MFGGDLWVWVGGMDDDTSLFADLAACLAGDEHSDATRGAWGIYGLVELFCVFSACK